LRAVGEDKRGNFWTWRDAMYEVAARLDPDSYRELATGVYGEMLLAGYTTVGEFHYLHHGPGGVPYDDPNEMAFSLLEAATEAGIRICLIDACYLQAGVDGTPLEGVQLRFGDGSGEAWDERVRGLLASGRFFDNEGDRESPLGLPHLGVAIHSVRAVPPAAMKTVAAVASSSLLPLHVHLSEQRAENEACLAATGLTPTDLLASAGALSRRATAVHATHVSPGDITRLGLFGVTICACPTTERHLGDGVGPFAELLEAGAGLSIGSDSHAVTDPFDESRSVELNQRLVREARGLTGPLDLLDAGSCGGARSLCLPAEGLGAGGLADLVAISTSSPRMAGQPLDRLSAGELAARVVYGAAPCDVDTVVVGGAVVVEGGEHVRLGPKRAVSERLAASITALLG
ncbi:MAG: formimidoylglutamate deiminase, partial [Acidimicrobiales bacterium]